MLQTCPAQQRTSDGRPETPPASDLFADDLLAGEVARGTGRDTGIGKEIALAYAELGADVAGASRSLDTPEPVAAAIEERGRAARAKTVDVRELEAVEETTPTVLDELGDVIVLVNDARANFPTPFVELSANGWRAVGGTILDGTACCTTSVGEQMIENGGGSIISMGATDSVDDAPFNAHSGVGEACVHDPMQTVAGEWGNTASGRTPSPPEPSRPRGSRRQPVGRSRICCSRRSPRTGRPAGRLRAAGGAPRFAGSPLRHRGLLHR